MNILQLDETMDSIPSNSLHMNHSSQHKSNTSSSTSSSSEHDTECGCCSTTIRGVNFLKQELDTLKVKIDQIHTRLPSSASRAHDDNDLNNTYSNTPVHNTSGSGRHVPGNSTYANMAADGKKVLILSDSMCGKMRFITSLNKGLNNKKAYRKYFPGATPDDVHHYCTRTLAHDKPDIVIIHVGTNKVNDGDPVEIARSIVKVVETCKDYGVNKVFVSGVIRRPDEMEKVDTLNRTLYQWSFLHGYTFISNSNIKEDCLGWDQLHLNYRGTNRLSSNFRRALNKPYV